MALSRCLLFGLLFLIATPVLATHDLDKVWYSTYKRAEQGCKDDAPSDTRCQLGGFGAYWSYSQCWGPYWKYCGAPIYRWVSCPYRQVPDLPYEGYRTSPGEPAPGCKKQKIDRPDYAISLDLEETSEDPGGRIALRAGATNEGNK